MMLFCFLLGLCTASTRLQVALVTSLPPESDSSELGVPCFVDGLEFADGSVLSVAPCLRCQCAEAQLTCFDLKCDPRFCAPIFNDDNWQHYLDFDSDSRHSHLAQVPNSDSLLNQSLLQLPAELRTAFGLLHMNSSSSTASIRHFEELQYDCCLSSKDTLCPYSLAFDYLTGESAAETTESESQESESSSENDSTEDGSDDGSDGDSQSAEELIAVVHMCSAQDTCSECLSLEYCFWQGDFCSAQCVMQWPGHCWLAQDSLQLLKKREENDNEEENEDSMDSDEIYNANETMNSNDTMPVTELLPVECPNALTLYLQLANGSKAHSRPRPLPLLAVRKYTNLLTHSLVTAVISMIPVPETVGNESAALKSLDCDGTCDWRRQTLTTNLVSFHIVEAVGGAKIECRLTLALTHDGEKSIPKVLSNDSFVGKLNAVLRSDFAKTEIADMRAVDLQCANYDCYAFKRSRHGQRKWWRHLRLTSSLLAVSLSTFLLTAIFTYLCSRYPPCAYCCCFAPVCVRRRCQQFAPCLCSKRRTLVAELEKCEERLRRMERRRLLLAQMRREELELGPESEESQRRLVEAVRESEQ